MPKYVTHASSDYCRVVAGQSSSRGGKTVDTVVLDVKLLERQEIVQAEARADGLDIRERLLCWRTLLYSVLG